MKLSVLIQFLLGFLIGVTLLVGGAAGAAYLYFVRTVTVPPKPDFPEAQTAKQSPAEDSTETTTPEAQTAPATDAPASDALATDREEQATPDTSEPEVPPGTYRARVTWPQGLSLRAEPSLEAERIGGIGYNWEILILEESSDKQWQKIQIPSSGQQGWVKAGNVERTDGEN